MGKYTHNHRQDEASLKVILQGLAKADLAHSLNDAPAPGMTNTITSTHMTKHTAISNTSDKYVNNNCKEMAITQEKPIDEGWTVETKGFQPKPTERIPTTTHNAFAILTSNNVPKICLPGQSQATTVDNVPLTL